MLGARCLDAPLMAALPLLSLLPLAHACSGHDAQPDAALCSKFTVSSCFWRKNSTLNCIMKRTHSTATRSRPASSFATMQVAQRASPSRESVSLILSVNFEFENLIEYLQPARITMAGTARETSSRRRPQAHCSCCTHQRARRRRSVRCVCRTTSREIRS